MVPKWLRLFLCGLCMGTADLIPGISGGTIAFILGFYRELLDSIHSLRTRWRFLLPLVLGIAVAILLLAGIFQYILNHEIYRSWLYSLFFGLILASLWFCVRNVYKWTAISGVVLLIGTAIAFLLTTSQVEPTNTYEVTIGSHVMSGVSEQTLSVMFKQGIIDEGTTVFQNGYTYALNEVVKVQEPKWLNSWLIVCGAIAICAMLLPGISGSYMLVVLGAYPVVIGAAANIANKDSLYILANLGVGIVIGALLFSQMISWLLRHYTDITLAGLIGFIVGAMPAVWPFWSYTYVYNPLQMEKGLLMQPMSPTFPIWDSAEFLVSIVLALTGFLFVVWMERATIKFKEVRG